MSATIQQCLAIGLKWVARVIGRGITIFYLPVIIIAASMQIQSHAVKEIMGGVLALAAYVISWWRLGLAGILLGIDTYWNWHFREHYRVWRILGVGNGYRPGWFLAFFSLRPGGY